MNYFFGLLISTISLILASVFLKQDVKYFFDEVAFIMVIGGTIAVTIATKPNITVITLFKLISKGLRQKHRRQDTANMCADYIKGNYSDKKEDMIENYILNRGTELSQLGFSVKEIEQILLLKISVEISTSEHVSSWIKSLAKYPPAFGLAGTVLGLIHLMRNLAESSSPAQTGTLMSIALLATLYGIIVSNFIISPLGEKIKISLEEDSVNADMALQTILMKAESGNLLKVQENLEQYMINGNQKLNLISPEMEAQSA